MEPNFSDYEKKVIREIARHMVEPNAIQKALKIAGKPVEKVMDAASRSNIKVIRKITGVVQQEIQKGILRSIRVTRRSHKIDVIIQKYHRYGVPVRDINEIDQYIKVQLAELISIVVLPQGHDRQNLTRFCPNS